MQIMSEPSSLTLICTGVTMLGMAVKTLRTDVFAA